MKINEILEFYDDVLEAKEVPEFSDEYDEEHNLTDKRKFVRLDKSCIESRPMVFLFISKLNRAIRFLIDIGAVHSYICAELLEGIEYDTQNRRTFKNSAGVEKETRGSFSTQIWIEDQQIDFVFGVNDNSSSKSLRQGVIGWDFFNAFRCNFFYGNHIMFTFLTERRDQLHQNIITT